MKLGLRRNDPKHGSVNYLGFITEQRRPFLKEFLESVSPFRRATDGLVVSRIERLSGPLDEIMLFSVHKFSIIMSDRNTLS